MKKDRCPFCCFGYFVRKDGKSACSNCGKKDRRKGNSMVDPMHERRNHRGSYWDLVYK